MREDSFATEILVDVALEVVFDLIEGFLSW
jgi:hypothetical protein